MQESNKYNKLSQDELNRYSRHIILDEIGLDGQIKLKNSKILVVGTGGLGSPVLLYLAAAGIGKIGIVDFDVVEESNLQRQIIHTSKDIGNLKVNSAYSKIKDINPNVDVSSYSTKLTSINALEIINNFDMVIDGTDNFQARYLINDACVILSKPFIYASIFKFEGQISVFNFKNGPCYRCLYPTPPPPNLVPTCSESGVIGVLPGIIGTIQANEAIKIVLKIGDVLSSKLLTFDGLKLKFKEFLFKKNEKNCICSKEKNTLKLIDYEEFCGLKNIKNDDIKEISSSELKLLINNKKEYEIIDVRQKKDFNLINIPSSKNIPFDEIFERIDEIDKNKTIIIVCKMGMTSKEIITKLKNKKISNNIYSLNGGITSWLNEEKI